MGIKLSKEKLDRIWPTLTPEMKDEIYAVALRGMIDLAASAGFTLTEKSSGVTPSIETPKKKKQVRKRHRDIKIHDRTFKDPAAIASFYKISRSTVSKYFKNESLEDNLPKVAAPVVKRANEVTFVGGA